MADDVLFPGHSTVSSFLRPSSNASEHASANFVSATNLQRPCPASLKIGLDKNNPDRFIWSESYHEEKGGLGDMQVYTKISEAEYLRLRKLGQIPKAIPSMCVIVIIGQKWKTPSCKMPHRGPW